MDFIFSLKKLGKFRLTAILFALLVLFILIVEKPGSASPEKIQQSQPLLFPRFLAEDTTHIVIDLPRSESIELRRGKTGWLFKEDLADAEKIDRFLETTQDLKSEALVSLNPEKQALFQVDPEQGIHVRIWKNSRELVNFYVGKKVSVNGQYVRLADENNVHETAPLFGDFTFEPLTLP